MKYMLVFNETVENFARRSSPDYAAYRDAWQAYVGEMGPLILAGEALQPPETGTTVRIRDGRTLVQDGPTPDSKEGLGGFVIIDVPDLDTALAWAKKAPCVQMGSVSVVPVWTMR